MGAVRPVGVVKAVTLFLVVIVVLAMFGKLGWLGKLAPRPTRKGSLPKPATCIHCGKHIIGKSGCDCRAKARDKG